MPAPGRRKVSEVWRMLRFFAAPENIDLENHRIRLLREERNHLRNVLRLKTGEDVWVSDGAQKEYHCVIEAYGEDDVQLRILYAQEPAYELPNRIVLFQSLPKSDKLELVIQKAVELGAAQVVIVQSRRCVAKLDEAKAEKKLKRWQEISESAARQSRRLRVPQVGPVIAFSEALEMAKALDQILIPYELETDMEKTRSAIARIHPGQSVGIFIGPEGGYEEAEVKRAVEAGAEPISLGHRILRTETAGLALLSALMIHLETGGNVEG